MRNLMAFSSLLFLISCSDVDDCQLNPFRESLLTQWTHSDIIAFDSITVVGLGRLGNDMDTILSGVGYAFPLDIDATEISYMFYTDSTDYELSISYQREIRIFEPECDPAIRYFDINIVSTNFTEATVRLSEAVDNLPNPVNVEISF